MFAYSNEKSKFESITNTTFKNNIDSEIIKSKYLKLLRNQNCLFTDNSESFLTENKFTKISKNFLLFASENFNCEF